jgi:hypothetical protein
MADGPAWLVAVTIQTTWIMGDMGHAEFLFAMNGGRTPGLLSNGVEKMGLSPASK